METTILYIIPIGVILACIMCQVAWARRSIMPRSDEDLEV